MWCYVDDQIDGIFRLLMSNYTLPVNIGNPDEISIAEFAREIITLTGTKQKTVHKPLPVGDPVQRQPDITLARQLLGWEPKTSRTEGMKKTIAYFKTLLKQHINGQK